MNERIRQVRTALNLSMAKFASLIGITSGAVSQFENGQRQCSSRTVADICRVFKVNEDWLRSGKGDMFLPKSREEEIAEIAAKMFMQDNPIRTKLQKIVTDMTEEQLELLLDIAKKLAEE